MNFKENKAFVIVFLSATENIKFSFFLICFNKKVNVEMPLVLHIYVKGVDLYLLLLSGEQLYRTTGLLWNTPLHSIYTTRQPAFVIRSVINNLDVAYIACLYFDFISIQENQI